MRGDGFNFYSAFRAGYNQRSRGGSVEQDGKISFARYLGRLRDQHLIYHATGRPGLMRHQNLPQHFLGDLAHFRWRFANMHSALESVFELPFAAASRMNLRFDNHINIAQLARDLFRFVKSRCDSASRGRHLEFLQ